MYKRQGIAIIGLNLASSAVNNIQGNGIELYSPAYYWSWGIAIVVCVTAIVLSSYGKGMIKMSSIVISLGEMCIRDRCKAILKPVGRTIGYVIT